MNDKTRLTHFNDMPDHYLEEIQVLTHKMIDALYPIILRHDYNLTMNALCQTITVMIRHIAEEQDGDTEAYMRQIADIMAKGILFNTEEKIKQLEAENE